MNIGLMTLCAKKTLLLVSLFCVLGMLFSGVSIYAAPQPPPSNGGLVNDSRPKVDTLPNNDPQAVWNTGLTIIFAVLASTAVLVIVVNGFLYILASGDPQKTAKARQGIIYSGIGLAVVVLAQVIVTFAVRSAT